MSAPLQATKAGDQSRVSLAFFRLPSYWRNLWLLLGPVVAAFIGIGVQALVLNLYLISLGFREDYLGLFSFANTAGIGCAALLAGRVSYRIGPRCTLLSAAVVLAGATAVPVASQNAVVLLAVAVVNGAALAHLFIPSATFVMDNAEPAQRSTPYAGHFAAQSVAIVIGSYLGGALPTALAADSNATTTGYTLTILVSSVLALLSVVPMYLADDSRARGCAASNARSVAKGDQRKQIRRDMAWIVAADTLVAALLGFGRPFINVFFKKRLGADAVQIGFVFALASAATVVASISGPSIGRRSGVIPTIVACRLLTVPILLGLTFALTFEVAASLYVARTLMMNATWPVDNALTMELVSPNLRATLAALRSVSWNFASAVTSGIAGLMIVGIGFTSIFFASGTFMVLGALAYLVAFGSRTEQPEEANDPVMSSFDSRRGDAT
jgi:predicted MFS family arabinose efflux permease